MSSDKWILQVVMTERDRELIESTAADGGHSISDWVRTTLGRSVKRHTGETLAKVTMGRPKKGDDK